MDNSRKNWDKNLNKKRIHSRKYYYLKNTDGTAHITSHPNSNKYNYIEYYSVDTEHIALTNIINNLKNNLSSYETIFKNYIKSVLHKDMYQASQLLSSLISDMQSLHPFFKNRPNEILCFLQNSLQDYLQHTYTYYIQNIFYMLPNTYKNEYLPITVLEIFKRFYFNLHTLIIEYPIDENSINKQNSPDDLWLIFLDAINERFCSSTDSMKITIAEIANKLRYDEDEKKTNNEKLTSTPIFYKLLHLRNVLEQYTFIFSDILVQTSKLSRTQLYCLFMTHICSEQYTEYFDNSNLQKHLWHEHFTDYLEDQRIICSPNELYELFVPTTYRDDNNPKIILIDCETTLFDKKTNYAYETLYNLDASQEKEEYKKQLSTALKSLNEFLPHNLDNIFNLEIHEFYYFEQLLFFEILEMVKDRYFIHKCKNSNCSYFFASQNRLRKYCKECASNRKASDKSYSESLAPIENIKKQYYAKYYHHISKSNLSDQNKAEAKRKLREWCNTTSVLVKRYLSENRGDDIDSFIQELPPF